MGKEIVKKEETTIAANVGFDADSLAIFEETGLCAGDDIDMNDVFIPKVQLCQSNSEVVQDGKANIGDYINSVTKQLLGKEVEIFVLKIEKWYQKFELIQKDGKVKKEYIEKFPRVGNKQEPKEYSIEGRNFINTKLTTMFCLLAEDLKKGQPQIYQIDFRATSFGTGMEIMSVIDTMCKMRLPNGKIGVPSYAKAFKIGSEKKKNADDQPYLIKSLVSSRWGINKEISEMLIFAKTLNEYLASKEEHIEESTVVEDDYIEATVVDTKSDPVDSDDIPF